MAQSRGSSKKPSSNPPDSMGSPLQSQLKRLKTSAFSRGASLAKLSLTAGARAATHAMGQFMRTDEENANRFQAMLKDQAVALAKELGQLKGSLMKVGQVLSMYGENLLPPEANAVLKTLQNQSPPLEWAAIEKVLKRRLSAEQLSLLEIEPVALASASLGQVHRAKRKSDGKWLALKIQYPGVDKAIDSDLKTFRSILSVTKLIPNGPQYDELFDEVRFMLHQEVDYRKEFELTREFHQYFSQDPRYVVPEPVSEFSGKKILATTYEEGVPIDGPVVLGLSQERRNALGIAALDVYFREIFEMGAIQTDPHFGNFRVRLGDGSVSHPDQLVLLDFGAVRKPSADFLKGYLDIVKGSHARDNDRILRGAFHLGFLRDEDPAEHQKLFLDFCALITEPFYPASAADEQKKLFDSEGRYLWRKSDLPKRVAKKGSEMAFAFKLRPPPREMVFLDRKLGGVCIILSVLDVRIHAHEVIRKYL